ncbi:MAG TPA: hypothetical protein GYA10_15160 [Alphaproteobacteria bacterium]|nr:hypothetical protein [Alphaproteobacteria bacterium]
MKTLLVLVPALLLSTAALAQQVPEASAKDLWCGVAFGIVSADAPADVTPEQQAIIQQFADGGRALVDKAKAVHLESGYTEESFATYMVTLTEDVTRQVNATDNSAKYSFEECSALLGL